MYREEKIGEVIDTYVQNGIKEIELSGGTQYYPDIERDLSEKQKNMVYNMPATHTFRRRRKILWLISHPAMTRYMISQENTIVDALDY